ncbi:methyltransferase family protein [Antricoccus suffuscus]|uniref:Methyltransferase family protein n=1 Tax=Antricoccus suffuscus TaxID=1629062 RepID=A0A2T1A6E8_9ACTN|nr:class I SAM-dependent methyltransferase [Antricoccus suffuscus]PRZ44183.1 methyltransferase family protein [Antricoccus suffuscus]
METSYAEDRRVVQETKNELLKKVYGLTNTADAERVYDDWATTYDSDTVGGMGYVAPALAAERLASLTAPGAVVLDAGCGTGLAGAELAKRADVVLDGVDLSPGMLDQARARGIYRNLSTADLTKPLEPANDSYDAVLCVGTLTAGHVGPAVLDELVRVTKPGGYVVATVHSFVWESEGFRAHLEELDAGTAVTVRQMDEQPYHTIEGLTCRLCVLEVR